MLCISWLSVCWDQKCGWAVGFPSVSFSIPWVCGGLGRGQGTFLLPLLPVTEVEGMGRAAWPWWDPWSPHCGFYFSQGVIGCCAVGRAMVSMVSWLCALVSLWPTSETGGQADGLYTGSCPGKGCASSSEFPLVSHNLFHLAEDDAVWIPTTL